MKDKTCADIIMLEITLLDFMNRGNYEEALLYVTNDFEGTTFDGKVYTPDQLNLELITNQKIVITKETFDCRQLTNTTYVLEYLAESEYAKQVVKHTSLYRIVDGELKLSKHYAIAVK